MKDLKSKNYRTPCQKIITVISTIILITGIGACAAWYKKDIENWELLVSGIVLAIVGFVLLCWKGKSNSLEREGTVCPECQHIVRPEVKYCTWCGAKMPENQQITANNEEE